jgi:hypothetical protein
MKRTFEEHGRRERIEAEASADLLGVEVKFVEGRTPLIVTPERLGDRYAMRGVGKHLHQVKRLGGQYAAGTDVLDHNRSTRNAISFTEEFERLLCVVKNVDEKGDVDRFVRKSDVLAVEEFNMQVCLWPPKHFDGADVEIRPTFTDFLGNEPIAGSDI